MKTSITSLALLCLCFYTLSVPVVNSKGIFSSCSAPDDAKRMEVNNMTITPPKLKKGGQLAVRVDCELKEEVTSGEVKFLLKYDTIPIVDETLDFCDLVAQINNLQCPLKKGPLKIDVAKQQLPDYIPSGMYEGKIIFSDQNGNELWCVKMDLEVAN